MQTTTIAHHDTRAQTTPTPTPTKTPTKTPERDSSRRRSLAARRSSSSSSPDTPPPPTTTTPSQPSSLPRINEYHYTHAPARPRARHRTRSHAFDARESDATPRASRRAPVPSTPTPSGVVLRRALRPRPPHASSSSADTRRPTTTDDRDRGIGRATTTGDPDAYLLVTIGEPPLPYTFPDLLVTIGESEVMIQTIHGRETTRDDTRRRRR